MRKRSIITLLLVSLLSLTLQAQPSWVKKATKSVFTLKTFAADGSLVASSNGFFTGTNGEAVSNFTPFKGASRAVVIDAQGKEMAVECILGANDMYDVVKFRVEGGKTQPLPIAVNTAPTGSMAWILPYREVKALANGAVRKAETIQGEYAYYTVAMTTPENAVSCPLLNDAGEVLGLIQQPATDKDSLSYAVSARYADSLKIVGLSLNDPTLQLTQIKKALPDDLREANLYLYLAVSAVDSATYAGLVSDFIVKFPAAPDGYGYRAELEANGGDFAQAEKDMEQVIKLSDKKDEAHFSYARLIYQKEIYQGNKPYANWSLDKAYTEARTALDANPLPGYRQLVADILFAQKKYAEAYEQYISLAETEMRGAEVFFSAARCKELLNDTTAMLALLDSALNTFSKPYLKEASPYLWARAEARRSAGKYREAVSDMNEYEELMKASVNDNFYYIRHQVEIEGRLYQQALNDIRRAIQLNPEETLYHAEKASLEVRVGLYDDAIQTARECISLAPDNSDGYLFLGVAQGQKGNKQEAIANLQKAKDLGDTQAEALMEKYK